MNEIDAGDCSGLTMEEMKAEYDKLICKNLSILYHHRFPKELQNRDRDKFFYRLDETLVAYLIIFCPLRYPNGESYEVRKMARNIDLVFARTWWQGWSL